MELEAYKWMMLVIMFLVCGCGMIPRCIPMTDKWQDALAYLNCFSAGLFLAMSLVHIMPEAAEIWSKYAT